MVAHWQRQRSPEYVDGIAGDGGAARGGDALDDDDELLPAAMELVVRSQVAEPHRHHRVPKLPIQRIPERYHACYRQPRFVP